MQKPCSTGSVSDPQARPGPRSNNTVGFEPAFLLEARHRDVGFLAVVAIDCDSVAKSLQGTLKVSDIMAGKRRPLEPKLSGETNRRFSSTERGIGSEADNPVRRQHARALKAPYRGRSCRAVQTIDANGDAMPAQEPLKLDHAGSMRHWIPQLENGIGALCNRRRPDLAGPFSFRGC
jgi:hypothetical protein